MVTTVTSGHGFSLSKSDTPDPVQAGGTLVYTLNWSVGGTAIAQGVVITDALPANVTYASCSGATCSQAGGIVTWNLNNQNPGRQRHGHGHGHRRQPAAQRHGADE